MERTMKRVLIIEPQMKQYRVAFYAKLYKALRAEGIQLRVAYSDPPPCDVKKRDNCDLPKEYGIKLSGYWPFRAKLLYQPLIRHFASDLVIVDQANKNLLNHFLLPLSPMGLKRIAVWRHGRFPRGVAFSEWYKRWNLNWVDWWFAYTKGTAKYLETRGVPAPKITAVQNSVDTRAIREYVRNRNPKDRAMLRRQLGIPVDAPTGIFCGILQGDKNVPFLIESSRNIRTRLPDFHLIIVGAGAEEDAVRRLAADAPWIHVSWPLFGKDKAEFLAIADAFFLPGRVCLAVLDAFAAGLPLITTRLKTHCPEIEYHEEGVNGLMSDHDPCAYAEAVSALLSRADYLALLQAGARASAEKYSVEDLMESFRSGIQSRLKVPDRASRVFEIRNRKTEPAPSASANHNRFVITTSWDDGHPLDLRIAELLAKHGLSGTFYIPLENTRPTLSPSQIHDLSSAFEVGAHTVHHLPLTTLSKDRARTEITESKRRLQEITGKPCPAFCFPSGRYANVHLKMLADAGYSSVRTVELLSLGGPRAHKELVIIPTTIQAYPQSSAAYLRNAIKRFRYKAVRNFVDHRPGCDWVLAAISLLHLARTAGGVFHLWGHSWEIEETGQWGALERVLSAMGECKEEARCVTNGELCANGG
jgi:L-malate glycosyltransferase